MPSKTIIKISWEDIQKYSKQLGEDIADKCPQCLRLIGVSRGGLVPTTLIAYQLGIRYVDTFCLETYDNSIKLGRSRIIKDLASYPHKSWEDQGGYQTVVIDDIVDSGSTYDTIKNRLPAATFAALFSKIPYKPELVAQRVAADQWLRFPWSDE